MLCAFLDDSGRMPVYLECHSYRLFSKGLLEFIPPWSVLCHAKGYHSKKQIANNSCFLQKHAVLWVMLNIEQKAALEAKEFCRDCHKFSNWQECDDCFRPLCYDCQLTYHRDGGRYYTLCHQHYTARIAEDGHIDDCASFCGEPCNCWVSKEEM